MTVGEGQGILACYSPWGRKELDMTGQVNSNDKAELVVKILPAIQEAKETQVRSLGRKIPWRREWQPTPVFLPGESHGQRSLASYSYRVTKSQTQLKDLAQ